MTDAYCRLAIGRDYDAAAPVRGGERGGWGFDLSSTHQTRQFADDANTVLENRAGDLGVIPGYRTWNTQVKWKVPGQAGLELLAGVTTWPTSATSRAPRMATWAKWWARRAWSTCRDD